MRCIVLVKQDPEYTGPDTWWRKGEYHADRAREAVKKAYENTTSSGRGGKPYSDRVAVVGPDQPWTEFVVKVTPQVSLLKIDAA